MATIQTRPTGEDVTAFLDSVTDARRRADGHELRTLLERVTGADAAMWGPSMVGFGSMPHTNTTGTNEWFVDTAVLEALVRAAWQSAQSAT